MTKKYMKSKDRRAIIVAEALKLAEKVGYRHVTREAISEAAGCAAGLVTLHLGTRVEMQRAILSEAIRTRCHRVIAQGIVDRHPKALRAPMELKEEAIRALSGV